jgi:Ca2+-binding EF-hand superfamily protein
MSSGRRGSTLATNVKDAKIDMAMLEQIMDALDVDGDGEVSKEEFKTPWLKLFPKMKEADFEKVWVEMDTDKSGTLDMGELAAYYGFNISPSAKRSGGGAEEMSDEQIMEVGPLSPPLSAPGPPPTQRRPSAPALALATVRRVHPRAPFQYLISSSAGAAAGGGAGGDGEGEGAAQEGEGGAEEEGAAARHTRRGPA